ncbi:hypothetical protein CTI14_00265 [Methylobacterium radiotolerans]|nr:hypothetical protein CTI14_00265 [Methylobacterium radiotolerans]
MHWSAPYVGLPWQERGLSRDGIACWGLCRLVYAEVLGLAVPDYAAEVASLEERAEVAAVFADGTLQGPWVGLPETDARSFDIAVFRRAGLDAHVGIVTSPGRMLHITAGQDSAIRGLCRRALGAAAVRNLPTPARRWGWPVQPSVAVVAQPSCLDAMLGRVTATVEPGRTIDEIIDLMLPEAVGPMRERLRVTVGEHVVLPGHWHLVRPKAGAQVMIRSVPAGDIMRNVLTIAVTVGALALGQFYAPELIAATGGFLSSGVASAAITGTTLLAGTLLINALVPPRSDAKNRATYAIQGMQNQLTPDGVVPLILGFVRYAPPYAAKPYTQAIGDYRYVNAAFCCGYGPIFMHNWRIGDTPIERFTGVTFETRTGYANDAPLQLYPSQVIEDALSIALQTTQVPAGGPQIRATAADAAYVELDITFASGLYAVDKDGNYQNFTVNILSSFRKVGDADWIGGPGISVTAKRTAAITRTTRIDFPERGRYEIQLERITTDWDEADQSNKDLQRHGRSAWSALRSFRPEYPIAFDKPLALAACNILATGQLNGMLDSLNCDMASICPDWDAASQTWVTRVTNNPASLFRYVLTGPAISYPLSDDEVAALGDWHVFCFNKGLTYNRVHDYEASVLDVLADIAAAGRASPQDSGTAWGVVIDRALDVISAHISPRNSWGFSGERPYVIYPDGYRVSFLDETNGFQKAERVVPWPGFSGSPRIVERSTCPASRTRIWFGRRPAPSVRGDPSSRHLHGEPGRRGPNLRPRRPGAAQPRRIGSGADRGARHGGGRVEGLPRPGRHLREVTGLRLPLPAQRRVEPASHRRRRR